MSWDLKPVSSSGSCLLRHRDARRAAEEKGAMSNLEVNLMKLFVATESRASFAIFADSKRVEQFHTSTILQIALSRLHQKVDEKHLHIFILIPKIWWLFLLLWRIPWYGGVLGGQRPGDDECFWYFLHKCYSGGGEEYFLQRDDSATTLHLGHQCLTELLESWQNFRKGDSLASWPAKAFLCFLRVCTVTT